MKFREFFRVPASAFFAFALSSFPTLAATRPAPAPAPGAPARTTPVAAPTPSPASGVDRDVRLLGGLSGREENDDGEPDDLFIKPALRVGPRGAAGAGASAGGRASTDSTTRAGGGGGGPTPLSAHANAAQMIEKLKGSLRGNEINVALLGSHKYMVGDCFGIKVSAGTFKLRLADPKVYFQGTALIFECGINHISFSAIKLRMKPNPNVLELCKFSKKFEVGGDADDVTIKLKMDPVVDLEHCRVFSSILPETTVRIGNLNLKPLQNDLDKAAKNAVEDALTAFLNFQFYDQMIRTFDDMIEADCPGADVRKGIERTIGGGGHGGGGPSSAGGADITALAQRVQQLETRVAALEQQGVSTSGAAQTTAGGTPDPKAKVAPSTGRSPASGTGSTPAASRPAINSKSGRENIPSVKMPTIQGVQPPSNIVANPELKGRLGRIVVAFPAGTKDVKARTEFFKAGDSKGIRTVHGNVEVEMTPGTYDLDIGGHRFGGVVVEQRSDTHVSVGVLRLNAGENTRMEIFEVGGKRGLQTLHGQNEIGLPIGNYEVEVNGQREMVTIQAGKITEY